MKSIIKKIKGFHVWWITIPNDPRELLIRAQQIDLMTTIVLAANITAFVIELLVWVYILK